MHFARHPSFAPTQAKVCIPVIISAFYVSRRSCHRNLVSQPVPKEKENRKAHCSLSRELENSLLGALAGTVSSVVAERASGTDGLAALADVAADVVVTTTDLGVNGGLVLGTANTLEVGGLGLFAGGGVDVAALRKGDLAVVAGALAANLHFSAGELGLDGLVDTGLDG